MTEMRILLWAMGTMRKNKVRNVTIREMAGVIKYPIKKENPGNKFRMV